MSNRQQRLRSQGLCTKCGKPAYIKLDGTSARVCTECYGKKMEWKKRYYRGKVLCVNGKFISGLNKRGYSEICEICGRGGLLVYHHWDDSDLNKGLWLCYRCHLIAEMVDKVDNGGTGINPVVLIIKYRAKRDSLDTPLETKKEPLRK